MKDHLQLFFKRTLLRLRVRKLIDHRRARAQPQAIFIWIPKTAGTSLLSALANSGCRKFKSLDRLRYQYAPGGLVTFSHVSLASLVEHKILPIEIYLRSWRFTFVRHPVERALSLFGYLHAKGVLPKNMVWEQFVEHLTDPPPLPQLSRFEQAKLNYEGDSLQWHDGAVPLPGLFNSLALSQCAPQTAWLRLPTTPAHLPSQQPLVHWVGRFESLPADFAQICRHLGLPPTRLPWKNRASDTPPPTVSAGDRQKLESIYAADYEAFGY